MLREQNLETKKELPKTKNMKTGLSMEEYSELITLEYILTWRYTKHLKRDTKRYMKLSKRKWDHGLLFDWNEYFKKYYQTYNK